MGGTYSTHEMGNIMLWHENLEEKKQQGRAKRRWEDNNKMNVKI
jgi:hypothetical protein